MSTSDAVTHRSTSYIALCAGCSKIFQATRADSLTCSPACRVLAHRNGATKRVRAMAASARVSSGLIVRCMAINILRPDLGEFCRTGAIEIDDASTQREMFKSFWAIVCKQINRTTLEPDTGAAGIDQADGVGEHHHVFDHAQEADYGNQ